MKSRIIEQLKEKERQAFLKLTPVDRILKMEMLLYEVISIKAKEEGISKGEIYRRYIKRDKKRRHEV